MGTHRIIALATAGAVVVSPVVATSPAHASPPGCVPANVVHAQPHGHGVGTIKALLADARISAVVRLPSGKEVRHGHTDDSGIGNVHFWASYADAGTTRRIRYTVTRGTKRSECLTVMEVAKK